MKKEAKDVISWLLISICLSIGGVGAYFYIWKVAKIISYKLVYEDQVKNTIHEMVKTDSLN